MILTPVSGIGHTLASNGATRCLLSTAQLGMGASARESTGRRPRGTHQGAGATARRSATADRTGNDAVHRWRRLHRRRRLPTSAGTADATARRRAGLRRSIHTAGLRRPVGPAAAEGVGGHSVDRARNRRRGVHGDCRGRRVLHREQVDERFPDIPGVSVPSFPRAMSFGTQQPSIPGSRPPSRPGGQLSVAGVGENKTIDCNDNSVSISGVSNTVTITGHCTNVTVSGMQNKVTLDSVRPDQRVGLRQRGHLPLRLTGHQ